ncbi:diacylglycerol O-acyltransferase / wax synthase [Marmoricola sp. URHA0025 HA25]
MDRTSALDSAFLHVETRTAALHIASLAIFEGPVPTQAEVRTALAHKLALVPRCRQRLAHVPFALGRPVWVDDPEFDLGRHVHRAAVAAPGGVEELREIAERLLSEPLDHALPLWEDWVLEGLAHDRWALLTKVHHTMVDGIAGTDLLSTMLEKSPDWSPVWTDRWQPSPVPGRWRLATDAVREGTALRLTELLTAPSAVRSVVREGVRHPRVATAAALQTARGIAGFARNARPTHVSSLVGPIGRDRGYGWTEVDLATVLAIHDRLGGTVNDLVLAAVTSAFRDLLLARGETPTAHSVRSLVPVSVRRPDQRGHLDNRVSAIITELPVELDDPRDRLTEVAIRMRALKASHEAQVGEQVAGVADALPPMPLAALLHVLFRLPHRNLTTVVTNVPGPAHRLHLAGRPMVAPYPYVPIADRLRSGIAVTSYEGRLLFGVTTDRDSMPDAQVLVDGIGAGFAELGEIAGVTTTEGIPR